MAESNVELSLHGTVVALVKEEDKATQFSAVYRGPPISALRFRASAPCAVHAIDIGGDVSTLSNGCSDPFEYKDGEISLNPTVWLADGDVVQMWVSAKVDTKMWLTVIGSYDDPTLKEGTASE